ncbi:MAG TPA: glycoside hydrolase family 97 N-terminal domain-containing protein, partial [Bacteroidales bacterium]|nr:glycoside hydrolase family 97 N-terminal domain-containing protein [Bacteroidales bacterium]
MKNLLSFFVVALIFYSMTGCRRAPQTTIESPSGNIRVELITLADGRIAYTVNFNNQPLIDTSAVAFEFLDAAPLRTGLTIVSSKTREFSETWEMPWGEQRYVENTFNELSVKIRESEGLQRIFNLVFRVYDDGLGFRYEFPEQPNMGKVY